MIFVICFLYALDVSDVGMNALANITPPTTEFSEMLNIPAIDNFDATSLTGSVVQDDPGTEKSMTSGNKEPQREG